MKLPAAIFICFISVSCQKQLHFDAAAPVVDPGIVQPDTSWQPMSQNSFWKYRSNSISADTTLLRCNGNSTVFSGTGFQEFDLARQGRPPGQAYFSRQGNRYEVRNVFTRMDEVMPRIFTGLVYLVGSQPRTGDGWQYDAGVSSNGYPARVNGLVQATGLTLTVAGRTYQQVLLTKLDVGYMLDPQSGYEIFQSYYFYLARGVGIIRTESVTGGGGPNNTNIVEQLVEYRVN